MRNNSKAFDYLNVIKYLIVFFSFLCLNKLESAVYPYSTAVYSSLLAIGGNFISTSILYVTSFILLGRPGLLASAAISLGAMLIITLFRLKFKSKTGLEYTFYTAISLLGFLFLGDTQIETQIEKRLLCLIISTCLTFVFIIAISALEKKGLKYKMNTEDYTAIIVCIVILGIGICNLISPLFWKGLSLFIILVTIYFFKTGVGVTVGSSLGVSLAVYYGNINYLACFIIIALVAEGLFSVSMYLSAIALIFTDYLIQAIFNVYPSYGVHDIIPVIIASLLFCILPTKLIANYKDKFCLFREKQLVRQTINRNRIMLSNKLFELSNAFTEMANAFNLFKQCETSIDKVKERTIYDINEKLCKACEGYTRCKSKEKSKNIGLNKMFDIGLAKGKLSLIDLPEELGNVCIHPTDIIYYTNRFLAEYRNYKLSTMNLTSSRAIISKEAEGVAEILKGLALESGTQLKYQSKLEKTLSEELFKNGFLVSEILIYGEEKRINVSLILNMKEFNLHNLQSIIGKNLNTSVILCEKTNINEEKIYLSFKRRVEYDAVFGVSKVKKDGSEVSGDTHSVLRISDEKFLVALSDGMGSGEKAETVSSISLSLIESFYKAGMNSNLILSTVNKLLSINTEDSFTALDVSVVNLKDRKVDFIKYGAPYGFIVNEGAVKIIEGNTLPLGILEELAPSVAQTDVYDGDMIVLLTDGISDAFGSSSAIIDFLRTVPAKNPQTLTNQLLAKAVSLTGGKHNDDMTALAVRIFKNKQ